jgi:hypothetical protein
MAEITLTLTLDRDIAERLEAAAERHNVTRDVLADTLLGIQLDVDEGRRDHVPLQVRESVPRKQGNSIVLPQGRFADRRDG